MISRMGLKLVLSTFFFVVLNAVIISKELESKTLKGASTSTLVIFLFVCLFVCFNLRF